MNGHEDFRKRLKDHIIENYNDQELACQAAVAMVKEYKRSYPVGFNGYETIRDTMQGWLKAQEPKKEYEILIESINYCGIIPLKHEVSSIKRLSDNEIFTVGDQILEGEIKAIRILDNGTCYLKDEDWFVELSEARKYVELTPTCEGFWKQFEICPVEKEFMKMEYDLLFGREFNKDDVLDFGKFCQLFNKDVNIEDIFRVWRDDRG